MGSYKSVFTLCVHVVSVFEDVWFRCSRRKRYVYTSNVGRVVTMVTISSINWEALVKTGSESRWQCRWCTWPCLISDCALRRNRWTKDNLPPAWHAAYEYECCVKSATGSNCLIMKTGWSQLGRWQYDNNFTFTLLTVLSIYKDELNTNICLLMNFIA